MSGTVALDSPRVMTGSDALNPRKVIPGFAMELETQGLDFATQNPPHDPIGDYISRDAVDLFGISGSLLSSDFLARVPEEWSNTMFRGDIMPSRHDLGEASTETVDQSPSLSRCHSVVLNLANVKQDITPCSEEARTCMPSALKILQNLHTVPPVCFSAGTARPDSATIKRRSTEYVLCSNREASQKISKMLTCPCLASFQMQLVLATICHKLTVWYRAMLKDSLNLLDGCSQRSSGSYTRISDHADVSEHILHQPITVGEYAIDINLQPKIRAQVVSGELQNLENFVRNFSSCLDSIPSRASMGRASSSLPSRPDQLNNSAAIHHHLRGFLDEQLQAAKADVNAVINRRPEGMNGSGQSGGLDMF